MQKDKIKHLNRMVAISVAIVSTFLAVSKVKDDNIVQAMMQAKSDALDTWNEYQAKKLKEHLARNTIAQNKALLLILGSKKSQALSETTFALKADLTRYKEEENALKVKAQSFEAKYDQLNYFDDQFDLSDACLSLALMAMAITALVAQDYLLYFSWVFSAIGLAFGFSGFMGWHLHPDWLVRLLS